MAVDSKLKSFIGKLNIKFVYRLQDLNMHRDQWNQLCFLSKQKLPMLSHAWISSYLKHRLRDNESWVCLMVFAEDSMVGVLPLLITEKRVLGLKTKLLRTPYDSHTHSVDFLCAKGMEGSVIQEMIKAIRNRWPNFYELEILHIPEASPTLKYICSNLHGIKPIVKFKSNASILEIIGAYDAFFSRMKKQFKKNLRRRQNKLLESGKVSISVYKSHQINKEVLESFLELESKGWKGRLGSAICQIEKVSKFYLNLARNLIKVGWLEIHFLNVDDQPVAGQFAINMNRMLINLKIAYDEEFANCSPGILLFNSIIYRAFITKDYQLINSLTKQPRHNNWNMNNQAYYDLHIFNEKLLPLMTGYATIKLKSAVKRLPGLKHIIKISKSRLKS